MGAQCGDIKEMARTEAGSRGDDAGCDHGTLESTPAPHSLDDDQDEETRRARLLAEHRGDSKEHRHSTHPPSAGGARGRPHHVGHARQDWRGHKKEAGGVLVKRGHRILVCW